MSNLQAVVELLRELHPEYNWPRGKKWVAQRQWEAIGRKESHAIFFRKEAYQERVVFVANAHYDHAVRILETSIV